MLTSKNYTDTKTISISGTCTGDHTHSVTAAGTITNSGEAEARSNNFTYKIWVRTA